MIIISCTSSIDLSTKISKLANAELLTPKVKNFSASEMLIEIPKSCKDREVYIVQSLSFSANNQVMELLLTINAARRSGARKIHLILPYLSYSRQDKESSDYSSVGMEVISTILNTSGISSLITIDIHNKNSIRLFNIEIKNINTSHLVASQPNKLIVMPDNGSKKRSNLEQNFISLEKMRHNDNISFKISHDISGMDCLIIDDIIDSGKTLCIAADFLIAQGAKSVDAYVTHALFSEKTVSMIDESVISNLTISNSIKQKIIPKNTKIIDISNLIYQAMNN